MRFILPLIILFACLSVAAQNKKVAILDRHIDASFTNEKISVILNRIGQQAGFSFSYNAAIISEDQVASVDMKNKAVREVLNELFRGSMLYKERDNHLILTKVVTKPAKAAVTSMIISGYVEDFATKEKISEASVYDKRSITSVVTDEFGFFRLRLERKPEESLSISISKKDYNDTTISITEPGNQYFHISLKAIKQRRDTVIFSEPAEPIDTVIADTAEQTEEVIPMHYESEPNVMNINDPIHRDIQASILPFIGTNGRLSGNVINNYSINFFGGFSRGTREIELGFMFNVDREDVSWLQIAGFGNFVGGNVYGVQAAGLFNVNGGETHAAQWASLFNVDFDDFYGVQMAGLVNANRQSANGVRIAGLTNIAAERSTGVQIAGLGNIQLNDYRGPQISGLFNINTGTIDGTQISGLFNYGKKVYGTQLGFINYADSLHGVPIGFLSYVNHGYHKLELSSNEIFYGNIAFRSGVRKFYNILTVGFKPENTFSADEKQVWSFGYGLGTARKLTRWLFLNLDITSEHVNKGGFTDALSSLNKLHAGFDFQIARKFSIYAGVTLNSYLTKTNYSDYPVLFGDYQPKILSEETFNGNVNMKNWLGAKLALRFL